MDLMSIFNGNQTIHNITVLDIIKDFAETNDETSPIKGGLALNYLYNNEQPSARNTIDIDYHFINKTSWEDFKKNATIKATNNSKLQVTYEFETVKINPNGESATISFIHPELSGKFKVDMNYGNYCKTINMNNITLYSPEMILADKLSVVCSHKIQRRCKDLYDIYLIALHESFEITDLVSEIRKKLDSRNVHLEKVSLLDYNILSNLINGYRKLKLMDMPSFEEVCKLNLKFLLPIIEMLENNINEKYIWDCKKQSWNTSKIFGNRIASDLNGIIYGETASGMLGLSTFPPYPVLVQNPKINLNMGIVRFSKENFNENHLIEIKDNLWITDKERTIVDMLEDGEYRILVESIETYLDENNTLEKLTSVAKYYNKEALLYKILKEIEEDKDSIF